MDFHAERFVSHVNFIFLLLSAEHLRYIFCFTEKENVSGYT